MGHIMLTDKEDTKIGQRNTSIEADFHRDIMNICRRYVNQLSIISIIGTLDMAKLETIELLSATNKDFSKEEQKE